MRAEGLARVRGLRSAAIAAAIGLAAISGAVAAGSVHVGQLAWKYCAALHIPAPVPTWAQPAYTAPAFELMSRLNMTSGADVGGASRPM